MGEKSRIKFFGSTAGVDPDFDGLGAMDYVNGYCSECDEEYQVPEALGDEPEKCPICGNELDT